MYNISNFKKSGSKIQYRILNHRFLPEGVNMELQNTERNNEQEK